MGKSRRVAHGDLRALYLAVGECKELGADPVAWRVHLIDRLLPLLDAAHGSSFDMERLGSRGDPTSATLLVDVGIPDESVRRAYRTLTVQSVAFLRDHAKVPLHAAAGRTLGPFTRRQMVDDLSWYGNDLTREHMRVTGLDDFLGSLTVTQSEATFSLGVQRSVGEPPFDIRDLRLFQLGLDEILPALGKRLVTGAVVSLHALAPRLRQTLLCLFDGDGEKQIAARLGLSRHTVHEYIRRLHRLFEARSRTELLARCAPYLPVLRAEADREINGSA